MLSELDLATVDEIKAEYRASDLPWFLGFSGGKDSSAVLKLVFSALRELKERPRAVTVIYCDTGVEIPLVRRLVRETLNQVEVEARAEGIPIEAKVAVPKLEDRYFVKVIGRGYPPPTNKFRWCTDRRSLSI